MVFKTNLVVPATNGYQLTEADMQDITGGSVNIIIKNNVAEAANAVITQNIEVNANPVTRASTLPVITVTPTYPTINMPPPPQIPSLPSYNGSAVVPKHSLPTEYEHSATNGFHCY
ncbi:MAG: hypothetical protein FWB72_06510 [Firmicutes bacterium]|nr:hypothetical protein [Bacillota bacterium]